MATIDSSETRGRVALIRAKALSGTPAKASRNMFWLPTHRRTRSCGNGVIRPVITALLGWNASFKSMPSTSR